MPANIKSFIQTITISESEEENKVFRLTLSNNEKVALENFTLFFRAAVNGGVMDPAVCQKAADIYRQESLANHPRAVLNLAWLYYKGLVGLALSKLEREKIALEYFNKALALGHSLALPYLGNIYLTNLAGVGSDQAAIDKGVGYYEQASVLLDDPYYTHVCGNYYYNGVVGKNLSYEERFRKAIVLHLQAVERGHKASIVTINNMIAQLRVKMVTGRQGNELYHQTTDILDLKLQSLSDEMKLIIAESFAKTLGKHDHLTDDLTIMLTSLSEYTSPKFQYWTRVILPANERDAKIRFLISFSPTTALGYISRDTTLAPEKKIEYLKYIKDNQAKRLTDGDINFIDVAIGTFGLQLSQDQSSLFSRLPKEVLDFTVAQLFSVKEEYKKPKTETTEEPRKPGCSLM